MTIEINARGALIELAVRKTWAINLISQAANSGRLGGWLPVEEPVPVFDAGRLITRCDEGLGALDTPMRRLAAGCGLGAHEMDALWFLSCVELEPRVTRALRLLLPATSVPEPTVQLLERAIFGEATSRESARLVARLRDLGLVECTTDVAVPLQRRVIRASDRTLDLARGVLELDPVLALVAELHDATETIAKVPSLLADAVQSGRTVFVTLGGANSDARFDAACSSVGCTLRVRAAEIAADPTTAARQLRAIARDSRLFGATVVMDGFESLADRMSLVEQTLLAQVPGPVLATVGRPVAPPSSRAALHVDVGMPDLAERTTRWAAALPTASPELVRECAEAFTVAGRKIAQVAAAMCNGAEPSLELARAMLRADVDAKLAGIANRVIVTQTWDDLVIPVEEFDLLIELCARIRYKDKVLGAWGFGDKVGRGRGVTALLSGPPGTGKTMIAGLIAQELGLDLYQIDLSQIVSKYIGETEKKLAEVFDAAESGHAVLLFDEADSLFGKRTDVKSSNDRYANLETNYLLQRIESFTGIALLTSNHESAIDAAFKRRLTTHIHMPSPDRAVREALWKAVLPTQARVDSNIDFPRLASEFEMTGGYIKNAVLRAAFLAASEDVPIGTAHLLRAARAEYRAMGRLVCG